MNEDQLADILAQHLDALLEGGSLPDGLPAQVADLLAVAQNLTEAAPSPRPEFGLALKESLLGPTPAGNGPIDPTNSAGAAGSAFGNHLVVIVVVSLVGLAVALTLLIGAVIFGITQSLPFRSPSSTSQPIPTDVIPTQSNPSITPANPTLTLPVPDQPGPTFSPAPTATPILDVLPGITVTVEIIIESPALVPGSSGGGDSGNDNGGSSGGGGNDHDRGHGNDADHHDEDNPGKGGDDD